MINRYWDVTATAQPTSQVGVKYYFTNAEYIALKDTMANHNGGASGYPTTISSVTELNMFKLTNATAFKDPHSSGATGIVITNHSTTPDTNQWVYSAFDTAHCAEFNVLSFSGGGGGQGGGSQPLPVKLLGFTATKIGSNQALLEWLTVSETNNSHFDIFRSYDGVHFESIGVVPGQGHSSDLHSYHYVDQSINSGETVVYYYLSQVDFDGTSSKSGMRKVHFNHIGFVQDVNLFPNPSHNKVHVVFKNVLENPVRLECYNPVGALVYDKTTNDQQNEINLSTFGPGLYTFKVSGQDIIRLYKFIKL